MRRLLLGLGLCVLACNQNRVKSIELNNEALDFHQRDLNSQAIEKLKEAIALDASCDVCHHTLASIYQATEAWSDAAVHYEAAAQLGGEAKDWSSLGYVLYKDAMKCAVSSDAADQARVMERLQKAEVALQTAVSADPDSYLAYYYQGQVYRELDRFEDAGKSFRKSIETNPGYPEAFNEYGMLFSELSYMKEAESVFTEGLRINANSSMLYNQLGVLYKKQGRYAEARDTLKKALEGGKVPDAAFNLAIVYYEMGSSQDKVDAKFYFDQFLGMPGANESMKSQARMFVTALGRENSK